METVVKTDVASASEPLLLAVRESGEKYILKYLKYPTTGGNADELALINEMCVAARELCEKELNLSLAQKTLTVFFSLEDAKRAKFSLELPYGPHSSITSVKITYRDGTSDLTLTANTDYYTSGNQYLTLHVAQVSGTAGTGEINGYEIELVAGFGASGVEVIPEALRVAMAKQVTEWYGKRDAYLPVLSSEVKKVLQQFTHKVWI